MIQVPILTVNLLNGQTFPERFADVLIYYNTASKPTEWETKYCISFIVIENNKLDKIAKRMYKIKGVCVRLFSVYIFCIDLKW